MTSKNEDEYKRLQTPHEEIMYCIESTNDIVSKILEILEKPKVREETLQELARRHGLGA